MIYADKKGKCRKLKMSKGESYFNHKKSASSVCYDLEK